MDWRENADYITIQRQDEYFCDKFFTLLLPAEPQSLKMFRSRSDYIPVFFFLRKLVEAMEEVIDFHNAATAMQITLQPYTRLIPWTTCIL